MSDALPDEGARATLDTAQAGALLCADRRYRYLLWRRWSEGHGTLLVIALNPSTADAHRDDPTVRRCVGFARDWGFRTLLVANLFAYRAAHPSDLRRAEDPVGPDNERLLRCALATAGRVLVAWGNGGRWRGRDRQVLESLSRPLCLGLTRLGAPRHPLYVPRGCLPEPYRGSDRV